jgi:hypothetical protein
MAGLVPAIHVFLSFSPVVPGALQHAVMLRRTGTSFFCQVTRFRICGAPLHAAPRAERR